MKNTQTYLLTSIFLGLSLLYTSCADVQGRRFGCECYDQVPTSTLTKAVTISPTKIESFSSSDEVTGPMTADGSCHATMELRFRWSDNEMAKTNTRPPIKYEFQTLFGYFPTNMGMERLETGTDGINTYIISISQAADKSKPEPNRYGIWVKYLNGIAAEDGAVLCNLNISYNKWNETFHSEGCLGGESSLIDG
jgi:hypothetical protein